MISTERATDADIAAALAVIAKHELAATRRRIAESATYTAGEYRQLTWLLDRTKITSVAGKLSATHPMGRIGKRYGRAVYATLERTINTLQLTPWALDYDRYLGADTDHGSQITW